MYDDNLSALNAFSDAVTVTAHNIANVNTADFRSLSGTYTGTPSGNVRLAVSSSDAGFDVQDRVTLSLRADEPAYADEAGINNVDLGREMVNLTVAQRGFEANAVTIAARADTDNVVLGLVDTRV